jgi:hypothetical protein
MDMDFVVTRPLVRPDLPPIRLLFVRSRVCSALPSDGPSRSLIGPCASLALRLHQAVQGTFTPKLLNMPDTRVSRPVGPVFVRGDQHDGSESGPEAYTSRAGRMSGQRNPDTIVLLAGELRRTRSNPEDRRRGRRLPDLLRAAKIRDAGKGAAPDRGKSGWSKGPTI